MLSRRHFLKQSTGLLGALYAGNSLARALPSSVNEDELSVLCRQLTDTWGSALLNMQVKDKADKNYSAIIYPPENAVHGRMGDTIYPFLHLAHVTNNSDYVDAAILLYRWMESTVSQPDGSWLNEPVKGAWKGTTVFSAIALGEALKQHGTLLDNNFKNELSARLKKSGDFICKNFNIDYGNINYPISATYGLSLLGEILDEPRFRRRGRELAHKALRFITAKDGFLTGEGGPYHKRSAKGCLSVDLGYNVEESLPSLVLYGLLTKDNEVLDAVSRALETHMQFMLPDGGWDNSWGTRNYKWTYWGSRTSDGCQPAYALMANRNPAFYKVALLNTQLLKANTHDGVLYGGPHYLSHGVSASLHHTFCHLKALVTILDHGVPTPPATFAKVTLPREQTYGSRFFSDIQTTLISHGAFRATVTAYDRNYKDFKGGHASGGALTMLWHEKAGLIFTASMNEYQLYEAGNMQVDKDPLSMPLTPRIELQEGGSTYLNIHDLTAGMKTTQEQDTIVIHTRSKLVNKDQQQPAAGGVNCEVIYRFSKDKVTLHFKHDAKEERPVKVIVPVISPSTENYEIKLAHTVEVHKQEGVVRVTADKKMMLLPMTEERVFNFVPGLEALPFCVEANETKIELGFFA
ncbi:MAG TPA: hypothetical protein VIM87_19890 [Chitinophaga sp.]|uniref:hypothetical protein n=1 Tax=Chitinophaga sp. TaxID=1869181 RepID=UPI002F937BF7